MKELGRRLWARQCSITGEGMNEGYLVNDDTCVKYESDLIALIRSWNVDEHNELSDDFILTESYNNEEYFWTAWEDENEYQYQEINGKLIEIK
tara:strand:+ start:81 stop:359 length:279 start_codon:yes stop_codon:yes gene_type:complete